MSKTVRCPHRYWLLFILLHELEIYQISGVAAKARAGILLLLFFLLATLSSFTRFAFAVHTVWVTIVL